MALERINSSRELMLIYLLLKFPNSAVSSPRTAKARHKIIVDIHRCSICVVWILSIRFVSWISYPWFAELLDSSIIMIEIHQFIMLQLRISRLIFKLFSHLDDFCGSGSSRQLLLAVLVTPVQSRSKWWLRMYHKLESRPYDGPFIKARQFKPGTERMLKSTSDAVL